MTFSQDLKRFTLKVNHLTPAVALRAGEIALECLTDGSPITGSPGSPGSPVQSGFLKASWQRWFPSNTEQIIATNAPYARSIEDGLDYSHGGKPMTLRSAVGGFHSLALLIAGWPRVVVQATKEVTGNG